MVVALVACQRRVSSLDLPVASSSASVARVSVASASDAELGARLCAGRARCQVRQRRALPGAAHVELVDLALARGEAEECDRGEYWLVAHAASNSAQRIAQDCNEQIEADTLAHAETRLTGSDLGITYEEAQSSDRCEGVDATFHLSPLHWVKEARWDGVRRQQRCQRENQIAIDWDASDHLARWTQTSCDTKPARASSALAGAAIPRFALAGSSVPTAVGSCGVLIDSARAGRWMKAGAIAANVRLRALVADDTLLIDIEGATTGTISLLAAGSAVGDGYHGGLGCGSDDERQLSVTTLHLQGDRLEKQGIRAPALKVSAREASVIHVTADRMSGIERLAVAYESATHERLASASLPSAARSRDLPALDGPFKAPERCQLEAGRLDVRRDNASGDPIVKLR